MRFHRTLATTLALCVLAVTALFASPATAGTAYSIDGSHSEVGFQVRHLLTKVRGSFNSFDGEIVMAEDPAASSVTFTIDASSIDTANDRRDGHLRSPDFFDVENHGEITFASSEVVATGDGTFDVTGVLTMRGVEKEITLPVAFLGEMAFRGGVRGGFETSTTIDRKDWGITWNSTLDQGGTVLGDEVTIEINLQVVRQEAEGGAAQ